MTSPINYCPDDDRLAQETLKRFNHPSCGFALIFLKKFLHRHVEKIYSAIRDDFRCLSYGPKVVMITLKMVAEMSYGCKWNTVQRHLINATHE